MLVPNYVHNKLVDENGIITEQWEMLISQLLYQLNRNFSNEGLVPPAQNADNIDIISASERVQEGTLLWNSTTKKLQVRLDDGTFHNVLTD